MNGCVGDAGGMCALTGRVCGSLETLYQHQSLSSLWRLADYAYSTPSPLLIYGNDGQVFRELQSQQGVRQGDPLSALMFALTLQPVLLAVCQAWPDINIGAVLDDCTLVSRPHLLVPAYDLVTQQAQVIGLAVQPSKCQLLYFGNATTPLDEHYPTVMPFLQRNNIPFRSAAGLLLGAAVGSDRHSPAMEAVFTDTGRLDGQFAVLDAIREDKMWVQEAFTLLRQSCVRRLDYVMRSTRPAAVARLVAEYHSKTMAVVYHKLGVTAMVAVQNMNAVGREMIRLQMQLPLAVGGFGVPDITETHHIAYLASLAATIEAGQGIASFRGYTAAHTRRLALTSHTQLHDTLTESIDAITERVRFLGGALGIDELATILPSNSTQFVLGFAPPSQRMLECIHFSSAKLQHRLTGLLHELMLGRLKLIVSGQRWQAARVVACQRECAADWLLARATEAPFVLHKEAFVTAARLRLGLPPKEPLPPGAECTGCRAIRGADSLVCDMHADQWHWLSCTTGAASLLITARHDAVVCTVAEAVRQAGGFAHIEPRPSQRDADQRRPDISVRLTPSPVIFLLDVAIIHPLGHTNLRHSNAIQAKERQKKSKYDKLAAERSAVFVPFIATTFGGLGKEALKFIDMLSAYARHSSAAASHKTIMDDLKFGIAVKIQQGNYKIIDTAWRYHTRHRGSDD